MRISELYRCRLARTENNFDTRALWRMIHDQKTSAVAGGNFACDGQPQSTAIAAAPGCAVERIKHPLAFRSGDARSVILYENRRRALAHTKRNFAACASVTDSVVDQIADQLAEQLWLAVHRGASFRPVITEVDIVLDCRVRPLLELVSRELGKIEIGHHHRARR